MARRKRLDVTFGAPRFSAKDTLDVGLPTEARQRTGKRDFRAKVPRQATISAPEKTFVQSGVDALSRGLSVFGGGDERAQVQRASDIANAIGYVTDPFSSFEQTGRNVREQLEGGRPVTTQDYINLATPAVAELLGVAGGRLARSAPVQRLAGWLGETKPRLVDPDFIEGRFRVVPRGAAPVASQGESVIVLRVGGPGSPLAFPEASAPSFAARPMLQGPAPIPELPAPGPGLPEWAAKPKGGQWWPDKPVDTGYGDITNYSPENAIRQMLGRYDINAAIEPNEVALREWFQRAAPRYIKNEMGTPDDPLRGLAERGMLHLPDLSAEGWSKSASDALMSDPIQHIMFPRNRKGGMPGAGDDFRGGVLSAMPWLTKLPATDEIYGVSPSSLSGLDLPHVFDELRNAMSPEVTGLPAELAVRPESLGRMSFPQGVEHVGRINQWRAKQMEQESQGLANNPAVHMLKEYPDSPQGMRWVELKQPEDSALPEGWSEVRPGVYASPDDYEHYSHPNAQALSDALRYEGEQMGHCVGGYCDDVASGRSRIFSLRDAKGAPHVTIETQPKPLGLTQDMADRFMEQAKAEARGLDFEDDDAYFNHLITRREALKDQWRAQEQAKNPFDIVQIKGKQNRAPIEDYLPYIQDFVKTQGPWGHIGDASNARMARLPDGRYLPYATIEEIARGPASMEIFKGDVDAATKSLSPWNLQTFSPEDWEQTKHLFEGYAYGGRVEAHRDFARNPLAVKDTCSCHNPLSVR